MKSKSIQITFFLTILFFLFIISGILMEFLRGKLFLPAIFIFLFLGIFLTYLTLKQKPKGKIRIFLLLTGGSTISFVLSVILHNLFYAVGIYFENIPIIKILAEIIHVTFFFISIPISPIAFLIGAIGTIILFFKKRKKL